MLETYKRNQINNMYRYTITIRDLNVRNNYYYFTVILIYYNMLIDDR